MKFFKVLKLYFSKFCRLTVNRQVNGYVPTEWQLLPYDWSTPWFFECESSGTPSGEPSLQKCKVFPKSLRMIRTALARSLGPVQLDLFQGEDHV